MGTTVVLDGEGRVELAQAVVSYSLDGTVEEITITADGDAKIGITEEAEGDCLIDGDGECGIVIQVEHGERQHYSGEYVVIPSMEDQTLSTKEKIMDDDVEVRKIPIYETTNLSGGTTLYIAMGEQ